VRCCSAAATCSAPRVRCWRARRTWAPPDALPGVAGAAADEQRRHCDRPVP
jgi:hypothetical protein